MRIETAAGSTMLEYMADVLGTNFLVRRDISTGTRGVTVVKFLRKRCFSRYG